MSGGPAALGGAILRSILAAMVSAATIETLLQQGELAEEEVQAAVDAWFATPSTTRVPVGSYELVVGTLLRQNGFLAKTMRDPDARRLEEGRFAKSIATRAAGEAMK